eukprot:765272-Hanusia_phi.AAC.2
MGLSGHLQTLDAWVVALLASGDKACLRPHVKQHEFTLAISFSCPMRILTRSTEAQGAGSLVGRARGAVGASSLRVSSDRNLTKTGNACYDGD